jgi:hypothetical protein
VVGFLGHPADSGVGESVGSCNLIGKESSYFTRSIQSHQLSVRVQTIRCREIKCSLKVGKILHFLLQIIQIEVPRYEISSVTKNAFCMKLVENLQLMIFEAFSGYFI